MRHRDAVEMLADSGVGGLGPTVWADLGCGDGTFTLALAELLAAGSVIHAMDRDADALRRVPSTHREVRIETHRGDFLMQPWPFGEVDGILMANALHYVRDQSTFIRDCSAHLRPPRRFLIVEYDTTRANPWVPYPVNRDRLTTVFTSAGYSSVVALGTRASVFQREPLYAASIVGEHA